MIIQGTLPPCSHTIVSSAGSKHCGSIGQIEDFGNYLGLAGLERATERTGAAVH